MTRRRITVLVLTTLAALALSSCAAGQNNVAHVAAPEHLAGFWLGLWQGFICPVTFVISLFTDTVSVYEVHNNGNWYDFGFVFGLSMIFGGSHGSNTARRRRSTAK